jgi:F0F1-type ATP synthase membrane subunit b/b'
MHSPLPRALLAIQHTNNDRFQIKSNLPGTAKEAKKDAEVAGADIQAQANKLGRDAKDTVDKVDAKLDQYRKDAQAEINKAASNTEKNLNAAVDKFDKNVSEVSLKRGQR